MTSYSLSYNAIRKYFTDHGVITDNGIFYNSPEFLNLEARDPLILSRYANFVMKRPRDEAYNQKVRRVVPVVARILREQLVADARLGTCTHVSNIIMQILEAEGVWAFGVMGAIELEFLPVLQIQKFHYYALDSEGGNAGHAWVVAPPFGIIDVSVEQQGYGHLRAREYIPQIVLHETQNSVTPRINQIVDPIIRNTFSGNDASFLRAFKKYHPQMYAIYNSFPTYVVQTDTAKITYIPTSNKLPDMQITNLQTAHFNKKPPFEIYQNLVIPALAE